jgi:hypothetical protein
MMYGLPDLFEAHIRTVENILLFLVFINKAVPFSLSLLRFVRESTFRLSYGQTVTCQLIRQFGISRIAWYVPRMRCDC